MDKEQLKENIKNLFQKLQQDSNYNGEEIKLIADLINHYSKELNKPKITRKSLNDYSNNLNFFIKSDIDKKANRYKKSIYLLNKEEPNELLEEYMFNELQKHLEKLS